MRLTTKTSEADPDHLSDPDPFETVSFHGSGPIKKNSQNQIQYHITKYYQNETDPPH